MDYDEELHVAWVGMAMVKAYDFAEAYCNHQCDDQQNRLHELNTARRALREHVMNQPASMSLTDPELRAGIELQRREIDRLREAVAAEREACAKAVERARLHMDGILGLTHETDFIATRITDFLAERIRARGGDTNVG